MDGREKERERERERERAKMLPKTALHKQELNNIFKLFAARM